VRSFRSDAERDDDMELSGALAVKIDLHQSDVHHIGLDQLVLTENPDAVILLTPAGQAGAMRFLSRPIEPQRLVDEIAACLGNGDADGDDPGR
jgi:hypothetical protein